MDHTEKNCTVVDEEDRERGYDWGLDIKASPRKGLHKNNEELEGLKVRKNLFVAKPKDSDTFPNRQDEHSLNNIAALRIPVDDDGEDNIREPSLLVNLPEDVGNPLIVSVKDGHECGNGSVGLEGICDGDRAGQNDVLGVGMELLAVHFDRHHDSASVLVSAGGLIIPQSADCAPVHDVDIIKSHEAASSCVPYTFNAGSLVPSSRSFIKARRKSGPRPSQKCVSKQENVAEVTTVSQAESHSKRKTWDTDTEMLDCDGDQKRSCSGYGIFLASDDIVAEVGDDQPREQQ